MTVWVLEMRSTEQWDRVSYREYTESVRKKTRFESTPKIQFTDSGHGIVPHVYEKKTGTRRLGKIVGPYSNEDWVRRWMRGEDPRTDPRHA